MGADPILDQPSEPRQQRVWEFVSRFSRRSLWNLQGIPLRIVANRTWKALFADNIFGIAAELGFYFFFSLFPTLFSASFILGLAARSADRIYEKLLQYLSLVAPIPKIGGRRDHKHAASLRKNCLDDRPRPGRTDFVALQETSALTPG
jgi:membrane protein